MTKNKKNIAIFLMTLFVVSFSFFVFYDYAQAASPLVPCGKSTDVGGGNEKCSLCHLVIGIKGIIDWGRNILVAVALTAITAGGIMYIISAGDEQMMQTAKNLIKQALIGVVIVLGAWLIVNTTMYLLATKDNSATDLQGGTLGIQSSGWDKFSCTGGGSEGGEFTNDQPSCGETASTCTPGIPQTSCDGSWTCTNNLNDSVTCPSQLIPACGNDSAPSCDAGCLGNEQNNADGGFSWTCTGSIVQSCSYTPPACGEESCECDSGDVWQCNSNSSSATWDCVSGGEYENCSWQCAENQQGCSDNGDCCSGSCDFTGVTPPQQGVCRDNSSTFCHELDPAGVCATRSDCGGGGFLVPYTGYVNSCNNPQDPVLSDGLPHIGETCCINPANLP